MAEIEIIPAIMPESFNDLNEKVSRVKDFVSLVQIDVMDGKFVQAKDWPYTESQENNLPKIDFDFEVDLMIENPRNAVESWIKAGAKRIIVHIESVENFGEILDAVSDRAELAIALNTATNNDIIYPLVDKVQAVQFMGIAEIGFQGQPFDEKVLGKIADLRAKFPKIIISVDGAVNLETAPRLVAAGANRLVSGSAIFESNNINEAIKQLKNVRHT